MPQRKFDDFDEYARDYRGIHNRSLRISGTDSDYFSEQKISEVRKNEVGDSPAILDLGCGDGNSAAFFHKHFTNADYFGLDVSEQAVAMAREKSIPDSRFVTYNGVDIPFPDGMFDIVFVSCVLHHIDFGMHEDFLFEVKRVMKDGGRLYVFEHNPFNPATRYVVRTCPFDADAVLLSSSYTRKLLSKLDFSAITIDFTLFFPRFGVFKPILGLERKLKWLPLGGQYFARSIKPPGIVGTND